MYVLVFCWIELYITQSKEVRAHHHFSSALLGLLPVTTLSKVIDVPKWSTQWNHATLLDAASCNSIASVATPEVLQSALTVCGLALSKRGRQSGRGTNIGKKDWERQRQIALWRTVIKYASYEWLRAFVVVWPAIQCCIKWIFPPQLFKSAVTASLFIRGMLEFQT